MKLSNFIVDIGKIVAYYPNLKKVTGSTTATILLCQLLYWCDKSRDYGWIYKTADEIEEETGLTQYEQKTAKAALAELEILECEVKRLDHTSRYRINKERLNALWENLTSGIGHSPEKKVAPVEYESPEEYFRRKKELEPKPEPTERLLVPGEKKDIVDGMLDVLSSPGAIKMRAKLSIKEKLTKKFHINVDSKKWDEFIDFVYSRELSGEPVDKFIDWALSPQGGFDPRFWTAEKMKTLYPQAFANKTAEAIKPDFVEKLPERKEEVFAPMPKNILGKKSSVE